MAKCTFCGDDIEKGTGKVKYLKEGKAIQLCSMKCEKNMFKLRRVARETPWTAEYRVVKEMRMATAQHKGESTKVESKKETKAEVKAKKARSEKKE